MDDEQQGLTRRQMIKRGAALGGALVWAVPVVQTIGMTPALAATPSGPPPGGCDTYYAIKFTENGSEDIAGQTTEHGQGHCMKATDCVPGGTDYARGYLIAGGWQIVFDPKICGEITILEAWVKSGAKAKGKDKPPSHDAMCVPAPQREIVGNVATFLYQDISHVEIKFCCKGGGE